MRARELRFSPKVRNSHFPNTRQCALTHSLSLSFSHYCVRRSYDWPPKKLLHKQQQRRDYWDIHPISRLLSGNFHLIVPSAYHRKYNWVNFRKRLECIFHLFITLELPLGLLLCLNWYSSALVTAGERNEAAYSL